MGTSIAAKPPKKVDDEQPSSILDTLSGWKKLLVTKEDLFHHHKTLGVLCLITYFVRFTQWRDDMGFATHPAWTIPTLALHWMLTASAFQFRIPTRRIRDGGRIWPQYRWHSLSFTSRTILLLGLFYYEQQRGLDPNYDMNTLIVFLNMAAVDYATYAVGDDFRSNTIRDLEGHPAGKFFFSCMHFNATAGLLWGLRSFSIPYYGMFIVQILPFIGTLRRKGIFASNFWGAVLYGSLLVGGFMVQGYQYQVKSGEKLHLVVRIIAMSAAFLRLNPFFPSYLWPIQNKYLIWSLMYMIIRHVRPFVNEMDAVKLRLVALGLLISLLVSAHFKIKAGYYPSNVIEAKAKAAKVK